MSVFEYTDKHAELYNLPFTENSEGDTGYKKYFTIYKENLKWMQMFVCLRLER